MLDTHMEGFSRLVWQVTGSMVNTGPLRIFSGDTTCSEVLYALIKVSIITLPFGSKSTIFHMQTQFKASADEFGKHCSKMRNLSRC